MTSIMESQVSYGTWREGLRGFPKFLRQLIEDVNPESLCDVGGGAAPALTPEESEHYGLDYTLMDISQTELDKSPNSFTKVRADVTDPDLCSAITRRYDMVQSHMLAEHVANPAVFHANMFKLLKPGGIAVHLLPTLWDPAFVLNRLVPERFTSWLLPKLQPTRHLDTDQGKFPAYYRWCRGPSSKQIARFENLGFEVMMMNGYFGTGYAIRIPPANRVIEWVTVLLLRNPRPLFTSYCVMVLRRPAEG